MKGPSRSIDGPGRAGTGDGDAPVPQFVTPARCLWLVVLVMVLAFFLRVYRLPSVPFGWHPDEATKGIMAREVLAGKHLPVFFSAFTGRDALYVYLEALFFALFGEGILAGRLLSAFIGVLTVALTYAVGKTLFGRRVGVFAAGMLAASLWHLIASRNGYRAVIQPLVQLPVIWFLFRGWRAGQSARAVRGRACNGWHFVIAGCFLGLTQYTYTAARVFPALVLALVFVALIVARALVVRCWRPLLWMVLVAIVIVMPLVVYFIQHPVDFYGRAEQISIFTPAFSGGDPWGRLWQSVKETARMFTRWGDPNYRFNPAGRPVFLNIEGTLFYIGLFLAGWFAVRARGLRRVAYVTAFLWLGIMLVPMTLSAEGLPYYQRAIGALPAVYFFPALALDALIALCQRYSGRALTVVRVLYAVISLLFLVGLGFQTYQAYFVDWHMVPRNDDDRRVAMVYVADYVARHDVPGALYISSEYAEHPTLAFLAPEVYDGVHWFNAQHSLPLPPPGVEATYVMLLETPPQPALMARAPGLRRVDVVQDRFDRPVFEVYHWQDGAYPAPAYRSPAMWSWEVAFEPGDPKGQRHAIDLPVNFGHVMLFLGHDRIGDDAVAPGETLAVILYWQLLERPARHYSIFVHLLDNESQIVGEFDGNWYGTRYWREGGDEMLLSYFPLRVKPDTPPGEYQLEIGVYHQPTGERLPVYEQDGEMVADRLLLQPVMVR